jgi:anti-sigma B factor antagonist
MSFIHNIIKKTARTVKTAVRFWFARVETERADLQERLKMANKNRIQMPAKIDANSAEPLKEQILREMERDAEILLDFGETGYVSSAGLRVILTVQKKMKAKGLELELCNVKQQILEVFELTGFAGIVVIS